MSVQITQGLLTKNAKDELFLNGKRVYYRTKIINQATQEQEALMRYTYHHVGRYVHASYEKWEHGFLVERNMNREIGFWLAMVFLIQDRKLTLPERIKKLVGRICLDTARGERFPASWTNDEFSRRFTLAVDEGSQLRFA